MRPLSKYQPCLVEGDGYARWRAPLLASVGSYCSYCETPINVDTEVEHKLPQSIFNAHATNWGNLLPACASCNNAKGTHPGRLVAGVYPSYAQWIWPDTSWSLGPAPDGRQGYVQTALAGQAGPIPAGAPTAQLLTFVHGRYSALTPAQQRFVIPTPPVGTDPEQLWIVPNEAYAGGAAWWGAVSTTLLDLQLDRWQSDDPLVVYDRRCSNRTDAYVGTISPALALVTGSIGDHLATDPAGDGLTGANGVPLDPQMSWILETVRSLLLATGFWSVWLWAFRRGLRQLGDARAAANLNRYFWRMLVEYAPVDGRNRQGPRFVFLQTNPATGVPWQPDTVLPGTDLARVPDLAWDGTNDANLGRPA